jgi:hypothetical protein
LGDALDIHLCRTPRCNSWAYQAENGFSKSNKHTNNKQFTVASLLTICALSVTIIMHCCIGLNPRLNLFINSGLWALWAAGFGMLWWWASKTLFNTCDAAHWNGDVGIMVCRIYKALFAFGMLGL